MQSMPEQPQMNSKEQLSSLPDKESQPLDNGMNPEQLQTAYPALLSNYHNLEMLGHGAQAMMLKALDKQDHPVAIKVFNYSKANDWKDVELFEREIAVLKNIKIDGVPKYIETIRTENEIYLVEQYVNASSLEKQIKSGRRFTVEESVTILEKTAYILKRLNDYIPPIVHRDIKPANLLVDKNLKVYLVDFGVVAKTHQTFSMTMAGTAGYVAPEQLYGKATPASDIYSLGATMLYLFSHVPPCDMKRKGILPDFDKYIPKSVPKWLSDTIKSMMSVDPDERPQNGDELLQYIHIQKIESKRPKSTQTKQDEVPTSDARQTEHEDSIEKEKSNHKDKQGNSQYFLTVKDKNKSPGQLIKKYRSYSKKSIVSFCFSILAAIIFLLGSYIVRVYFNDHYYLEILSFIRISMSYVPFIPLGAFALFGFYVGYSSSREQAMLSLPGLVDVNKDLVENALKGNSQAQYFIGRKYETGDGAEQDKAVAFEWYQLAAEKGNKEAQDKIDAMWSNQDA